MHENKLSRSYQENLIIALCYNKEVCNQLADVLDVEFFDGEPFKEIAEQALLFFSGYNEPIGDHLPDFFDETLNRNDEKSELYRSIFESIYDNRNSINTKFVMTYVENFIKRGRVLRALFESIELIKNNEFDESQKRLFKSFDTSFNIDYGLPFWDSDKVVGVLQEGDENEGVSLGIPHFDKIGLKLYPGELFLYAASYGTGKSWFCVHCGFNAMRFNKKVLHISLEMSEKQVAERYMQRCFAISKWERKPVRIEFVEENGHITGMNKIKINPKASFKDDDIYRYIDDRLGRFHQSGNLIIKQFPTGEASINTIQHYIDYISRKHGFIPEIVIIDYPDLMRSEGFNRDYRLSINEIYKSLRGLSVQHGYCIIAPSQTNRAAMMEDVSLVGGQHLAEDFGKIAIADRAIFYNQTRYEQHLGLARLYVDKNREGRKWDIVAITQCYDMGHFVDDSMLLKSKNTYDNIVNQLNRE